MALSVVGYLWRHVWCPKTPICAIHTVFIQTCQSVVTLKETVSDKRVPFFFTSKLLGTCIRLSATITACCFLLQCSDKVDLHGSLLFFYLTINKHPKNTYRQHRPVYSSTLMLYLQKRHKGGVLIKSYKTHIRMFCQMISNVNRSQITAIQKYNMFNSIWGNHHDSLYITATLRLTITWS